MVVLYEFDQEGVHNTHSWVKFMLTPAPTHMRARVSIEDNYFNDVLSTKYEPMPPEIIIDLMENT